MALYSLGINTTAAASAAAYAELRSSTQRMYLREIGFFCNAATSSSVGLGRPAAIGVTPTSPITGLQVDSADAAPGGTTAIAWGTAPTVPANFLRRVVLPATIGAGLIWTFNRGELVIPASNSLVLWNFGASTASVLAAYFVWEE